MLLSAVSVLVVAQSSSEIPEGLMNNSVLFCTTKLAQATLGKYLALARLEMLNTNRGKTTDLGYLRTEEHSARPEKVSNRDIIFCTRH